MGVVPERVARPLRQFAFRWGGEAVRRLTDATADWASVGRESPRAAAFGSFGPGSLLRYPLGAVYNERYVHIGAGTLIGPDVALAAGMSPGQEMLSERVVTIGDRCLIGRGSGIVGHYSIEIGDDVFTGHYVYITDQNHGYDDLTTPIGQQTQPEQAVRVGSGSWIGHGSVILPGVTIGEHCVIGANSVVTSDVPDYSVAVGAPARAVKQLK